MNPKRIRQILTTDLSRNIERHIAAGHTDHNRDEEAKRVVAASEAREKRAAEPAALLNALVWGRFFGPVGYQPRELQGTFGAGPKEFPRLFPLNHDFRLLPTVTRDGAEVTPALHLEGNVEMRYAYDSRNRPKRVTSSTVTMAFLLLRVPEVADIGALEAPIADFSLNNLPNDNGMTLSGFRLARETGNRAEGSVWHNGAPIATDSVEHELLCSVLNEALAVDALRRQDGEIR